MPTDPIIKCFHVASSERRFWLKYRSTAVAPDDATSEFGFVPARLADDRFQSHTHFIVPGPVWM